MIGEQNRYFIIMRPTNAVDGANQPLPTAWERHKGKWARVRGETGMGTIRAASHANGVNTPLDRYSVRFNYDRSITDDMQLREATESGQRFAILAVRHDMAEREWTDVVVEVGGSNA